MTRRTRAIVPIHLYGRRADVSSLRQLGVRIVEDAAQAHGSAEVADVAAFSFYPTKNLGALGDGGAIVTSDDDVAAAADRLRTYRDAVERPFQSRLDTVQAAVLRAKLPYLADWNARRRRLAARYDEGLAGAPVTPPAAGGRHVYHLYVVRSPDRDALRARLAERGVETIAHYPLAVHAHRAWSSLARPGLEESERAAAEVLSLPLYPQLTDVEADAVIEAVLAG
jgi:dTDP-4-amino-4,6-dideoxygalactose transaminase